MLLAHPTARPGLPSQGTLRITVTPPPISGVRGDVSGRQRASPHHHLRPAALPATLLHLTEPTIAAASAALFSAATVYTVCVYGVTLASTRRALKLHATRLPTAPLIGLWAAAIALVAASAPARTAVAAAFAAGWTAATAPPGVPTPGWLPAFGSAFAHPAVSAAAWAHLLAIDLVQARWILVDGAGAGVPTRHSLALTLMAGPLGLVCHVATRALWWGKVGGCRPGGAAAATA